MERTRIARNPDGKELGSLASCSVDRTRKLVRAEKPHVQSTWPRRWGPSSQFDTGSSSELGLPGSQFPQMKTAEEVCMPDWTPPLSPHGNPIEKNTEACRDSDPSVVSAPRGRALACGSYIFYPWNVLGTPSSYCMLILYRTPYEMFSVDYTMQRSSRPIRQGL